MSSSQNEHTLGGGGGRGVLENEQRRIKEEGGGGQNSRILSERNFEWPHIWASNTMLSLR